MLKQLTHQTEVDVNITKVSHVRRLCNAKGWTLDVFIGKMRSEAGIGEKTARRIYEGETNLRIDTAAKVAYLLGLRDIGSLIEMKPPKK